MKDFPSIILEHHRATVRLVPDIMDVQTESFTNPITGEEQDTKI
jgi:hypothetical protein